MSRLEDLIAELCPDGVEHSLLGDIATLVRGNGMPRSVLTDSGVGAVHYGQIYTSYGAWTKETLSFVTPEMAAKLTKVNRGDIIITNTSENVEDVGKAVAWLGDDQIVTGGHASVIKHKMHPKFLAYWFQSPSFFRQKKALATGAKVIDVSAAKLAGVRIPLPPQEIQCEIVRILDHFSGLRTELETELEAELKARQRQYAHYLHALVAVRKPEVEWVPMSRVGEFVRGRRFTKNNVVEEGIASIHYGEIYTHYGTSASSALTHVHESLRPRLRFAQPGDVVIAAVGETVEDVGKAVAWMGEEEVAVHDDCYVFSHSLNPEFVSYFLQTAAFHSEKNKYVARAKVKRLSGDSLGKISIPVPSADEQARIVAILNKFDALVNDISIGLPAELAARRKQYEYYRDKLLTFEEKK